MKSVPFVMCLTNFVAAEFTANALLAIGAKPAMVAEPDEAEELAAKADAVLVNLGTVTSLQARAMAGAAAVCRRLRIPWVLDPVGVHLLAFRKRACESLLPFRPAIVRGNHDEISFLSGQLGKFPGAEGPVVLSTGETDRVWGGTISEPIAVGGGVPELRSVTAIGCVQGALAAAFLGRGLAPEVAAVGVSRLVKRAGEVACARANGTGGLRTQFVDALWRFSRRVGENPMDAEFWNGMEKEGES